MLLWTALLVAVLSCTGCSGCVGDSSSAGPEPSPRGAGPAPGRLIRGRPLMHGLLVGFDAGGDAAGGPGAGPDQ